MGGRRHLVAAGNPLVNDYLLQSALSTLRAKIDESIRMSEALTFCDMVGLARIQGMKRALSIMEDMMYEDAQHRIETSCA